MPPLAGLMFFCSRYRSVTVLDSQYARHVLLSCCFSICAQHVPASVFVRQCTINTAAAAEAPMARPTPAAR